MSAQTVVKYIFFCCTILGLVGWNVFLHKRFEKQIEGLQSQLEANGREKRSLSQYLLDNTRGGALYIRWGRSTCPDDESDLVYEGVAGGTHYLHTSGGAEYLCLTRDVQYVPGAIPLKATYVAMIYGAEFQVNPGSNIGGLFNTKNSAPSPIHDSDVMCAVCKSKVKTTKLMIPGRKECYSGWKIEYWGYLMTQSSTNASHHAWHSYACVDEAPEVQEHGQRNDNGALMYHVQGVCGSLPCAPYVNGIPITCVVCTQ